MADDPNGTARATIATLDARVQGLDRDYQDLKRTLLDLDSKIDQSISSLGHEFRNALSTLTTKLEQRQTPFVAILSTGIASFVAMGGLLSVIGALAYGPIQRDTTRLDTAVSAILDRGVFQREYNNDQIRINATLDRLRTETSSNVQQQRYNTDQDRLSKTLDEMRSSIEALRLRTYDMHGRLSTNEQFAKDMDRRYDAVSNRLAQHIRDYLQAMREIDRGHGRQQ